MDDETAEVNYVVILRKSPLMLAGTILFGYLAFKCYEEWTKLTPLEEGEND